MTRLSIWRAGMVVLCCLASGPVHAGPPYRTDDPEPTELRHFEIYTFSTGTVVSGDTTGTLPGIEFDYGLIPNGQLTIDTVAAFDSPSSGPMQYGYGDTPISFKYRFIQEDSKGWRPQVAVFPQVNLPTGDEDRGLGVGHVQVFLPMWFQKSFGDWTIDGGGGYWINQGGADKNFWFSGVLLQRKVTDKLLSAEKYSIKPLTRLMEMTARRSTSGPSTTSMNTTTSCFRLVEACKTPTRRTISPGT